MFKLHELDLVIELTNDPRLLDDLAAAKPESVGVIGKAASRLVHDIVTIYQQLEVREEEVSMATGKSAHAIHEHLDQDGTLRYCDVAAYPLLNRGNQVGQALCRC